MAGVSAGSKTGISYDARGLAEPDAEAPGTAEIDGGRARIDATDLKLRRLIYGEGIADVTVVNPGSKHSLAVGILKRCQITFEGSPGWFACGLIDGPEVRIDGRVGWSCAENMMSGSIVVERSAGSLTGAALRGGDLVVKGDVGARTGIDQKGGTIIVTGSVGINTGFMMQRGPPNHLRQRRQRARRLHVRRDPLRGRPGGLAGESTASPANGPTPTPRWWSASSGSTGWGRRLSSRSSCAASSSTTTTASSRPSASWSSRRPR